MLILFCSNPLNTREVDEDYRNEYEAAVEAGMQAFLFSYEELVHGQVSGLPEQADLGDFYRRLAAS